MQELESRRPAKGRRLFPFQAAAIARAPTMPARRAWMICSASATIRWISAAQVGMSWIRPWIWPADQMPASLSPTS